MPRSITESLSQAAKSNLGLLSALIEALPDALWAKKAGAWPVWQHVIHAVSGADLFTPGQPAAPPAGLTPDILQLKAVGPEAPAKAAAKAYLEAVLAKFEAFAATLNDAGLTAPNQALAAIGLPWDLATTLAALGSHTAYHVGYGDALLRGEGLPGVF
jgi:hypothetical protein